MKLSEREGLSHFLYHCHPGQGPAGLLGDLSPIFSPFLGVYSGSGSHLPVFSSSGMALTVDVVGPAPWGFRISGGRDFHTPIIVTKVRSVFRR